MSKGTWGYYRAIWQDITSRPVKLIRCFAILTLCVTFMFAYVQIQTPSTDHIVTGDYFVYMKVDDLSVSSRFLERVLSLKNQYAFEAQVYCHAGNGDGVEIVGIETSDFYGNIPAREENVIRVSNSLLPSEYNTRTDEVTLTLNGKVYTCIGKANFLKSDVLNTLKKDETRNTVLDMTLSVNPAMTTYDEVDVYINKNARLQYEQFMKPFRPSQIFFTIEAYHAAGLPVYGCALIFDRPLAGEERAAFLSAFDDMPYTECTNISYNSLTQVKERLEKSRIANMVRLLSIVSLFLFMQLISWKIWIGDLRKPMEVFCMLGLSYARQEWLLLALLMLLGLIPFALGTGISYGLSALVYEPVFYQRWEMRYVLIVLVFYLAALAFYSLFCLAGNVWRIHRKEVVL